MNSKIVMMKRLVYSLAIVALGFYFAEASEALVELDKVIEKSFPINADGTLEIRNKYGNVDITDWDKNEISIKVTIDVKTSNQKKADEIFDRISIDFSNSSSFVSGVTEIESKRSWFNWGSWNGPEYKINYEVKMPASVHLKCRNKYGNTFITDLNNGAELYMGYGSIRMGSVEGETTLELSYGNIDFGDFGDLNAAIKYSKMNGSSTQDFKIDSKYSNVSIGDAKTVQADTKYDHYVIDRVDRVMNQGKYDSWRIKEITDFFIDSKYTGVVIGKLERELKANLGYGSLKVEDLPCGEGQVEMETSYTEVVFDTNDCGDIEVDYQGSYTGTNFNGSLGELLRRDGKQSWLKTKLGTGGLRVKLDMRYGGIKIR